MITLDNIHLLDDDEIHSFLSQSLNQLLKHQDLDATTMRAVMLAIMHGRCPDALMGAILIALRLKGESINEISVAADVMRQLADKVVLDDLTGVVDIVGTGGDGASLFNVSTAAAFVVASSGAIVAKHGNRGVSTKSGSSDLLQSAGVRLDLDNQQIHACLHEQQLGFLFAPNHHKAMKHAIGVRAQLKARTIFNVLGPLTNPAGVVNSVIGVFDKSLCHPLAQVLKNLGSRHVIVVHSTDGLDEFSLAGDNFVSELKDGVITDYIVRPDDVNLATQSLEGLTVSSPEDSLSLIKQALQGTSDDARIKKAQDIIAFNAGAAIYVAGKADSLRHGVELAKQLINHGQGYQKLQKFAAFTQSLKST
ncbi:MULTISPECIES: anthranilate phosphoribosyltransferase [unclassified Moraxella]|uniref:anthranilate phosphoribosyltransferase n=1 Tax=unclassified Moraxella TaxID=2685852 RepID=UPI00359CCB8B